MASTLEKPLAQVGSYQLLERIGSGGMSEVFKAQHRKHGLYVAIKILKSEAMENPSLLQRFTTEFDVISKLEHPNLVRGFEAGKIGKNPYIVMEYVHGQSLSHVIRKKQHLSESEAEHIFDQVCSGLEAAHHMQIVHRDIKPANILVTEDGNAKLTDLGLAKVLDSEEALTRTKTSLGTLHYMAPEQFENARNADVRTDIYGLGASLYHALTGVLPFYGGGNFAVMSRKLQNQLVPPDEIVPNLPKHLVHLILDSMQVDPEKRPGTCQEFAIRLRTQETVHDREQAPIPNDNRQSARHGTEQPTVCRSIYAVGTNDWRGTIHDVSYTGVCFTLPRRFEPKTVLLIEFIDKYLDARITHAIEVKWVRADGKKWRFGGKFQKALSKTELESILEAKEIDTQTSNPNLLIAVQPK